MSDWPFEPATPADYGIPERRLDPPVDLREQPECCCPLEGRSSPECPMHAWRSGPLYPAIRIRDAAGTLRTGYQPEEEEEDVRF